MDVGIEFLQLLVPPSVVPVGMSVFMFFYFYLFEVDQLGVSACGEKTK
jgi:hypothetical protein